MTSFAFSIWSITCVVIRPGAAISSERTAVSPHFCMAGRMIKFSSLSEAIPIVYLRNNKAKPYPYVVFKVDFDYTDVISGEFKNVLITVSGYSDNSSSVEINDLVLLIKNTFNNVAITSDTTGTFDIISEEIDQQPDPNINTWGCLVRFVGNSK